MEGNMNNSPIPGCSFWTQPQPSAFQYGNAQPSQPTHPPPNASTSNNTSTGPEVKCFPRNSDPQGFCNRNPGINLDPQSQPANSWNNIHSYTISYIPTSVLLPNSSFVPNFAPTFQQPFQPPMYNPQQAGPNPNGFPPMNSQGSVRSGNGSHARNSNRPQFRFQYRNHVGTQTDSWTSGQNNFTNQENNDRNIPTNLSTSSTQAASVVENESESSNVIINGLEDSSSDSDTSVCEIDGFTFTAFSTYEELLLSGSGSRLLRRDPEVPNSSVEPATVVPSTVLESQSNETTRQNERHRGSFSSSENNDSNQPSVPTVTERRARGCPKKNPASNNPSTASKGASSDKKRRGRGRGRGKK